MIIHGIVMVSEVCVRVWLRPPGSVYSAHVMSSLFRVVPEASWNILILCLWVWLGLWKVLPATILAAKRLACCSRLVTSSSPGQPSAVNEGSLLTNSPLLRWVISWLPWALVLNAVAPSPSCVGPGVSTYMAISSNKDHNKWLYLNS